MKIFIIIIFGTACVRTCSSFIKAKNEENKIGLFSSALVMLTTCYAYYEMLKLIL